MAKAEFKIQGIEELKRRLLKKKELIESQLDMRLLQLAENAVTHAKHNKGYKDHTANLKNTISFALFKDGELMKKVIGLNNELPHEEQDKAVDSSFIENKLEEYCQQGGVIKPSGYSLVIVAPMEYAQHVEHKGYNVLHLTKYFVQDEIKNELKEALEAIDCK